MFRSSRFAIVASLVLALVVPEVNGALLGKLLTSSTLRKTGDLVVGWAAGKAIDFTLGLGQKTKLKEAKKGLEEQLPHLLQAIATSVGAERRAREEELALVREQLALLERTLRAEHEADVKAVLADQRALNLRVEDLEARVSRIETEVEDLRYRVDLLEEALISECRDLIRAPPFGAQGFRVRDTRQSVLTDFSRGDRASVSARVLLNACTADLTLRGMLIQIAAITYEAATDVSLHVTFKHLRPGDFDAIRMDQLARYEYPLQRSTFPVDGQVQEIFVPYAEIPFPSPSERIAMAIVVTLDGRVVYSVPDRVLSCVFAQRINCRWGR